MTEITQERDEEYWKDTGEPKCTECHNPLGAHAPDCSHHWTAIKEIIKEMPTPIIEVNPE